MTGPTIIGLDEGDITCPICGETILDEYGSQDQPACTHVRFIYHREGFEYIDPELQKELTAEEASTEKRGKEFDTWDALKAHTGPDSIILDQTDRGMACDLSRLLSGSAFASRSLMAPVTASTPFVCR